MPKTMEHRVDGELFILVHGKGAPSDRDWGAYLQDVRAWAGAIEQMKTMVVTCGGAPTTAQRNRLNAILSGRSTRVSVMSSSLLARGATLALGWLNPGIRVFSPQNHRRAFDHLFIEADRRKRVLGLIAQMEKALKPARRSAAKRSGVQRTTQRRPTPAAEKARPG
ncbi:MAG: hypothetical protein QM765_36925 [Myxococcales bacterium]